MKNIKLLDCTLRDGGYINDWEFGHFNLIRIFERLVSSGVEIIEIGFLDNSREFDINRSIFPKTEDAEKIYNNVDKKKSLIVAMVDYGTCPIENLQPANESFIDGIRVIFKKHLRNEAMEYCRQINKLGYKVFSQAVSITSYTDEELFDLVRLVNDVKPYAMSMVDTYGLLYKENMMHIFKVIDETLDTEIGIGYHAHNNFQLGFSNVMEILRQDIERPIIVDGTLYGMGKSAGNAPLELIAMNMNEIYGKNYEISQMLEAIDCNIMKIYEEHYWGYNMFYFLAASNHCHPSYVEDLLKKHTLSIKSINTILDKITSDKKLMYDHEYLEQLYYDYQKNECNDRNDRNHLKEILSNKEVLLLGPGNSIKTKIDPIKSFIKEHNPITIAVNFMPMDFHVDFMFITNPRRYNRIINGLYKEKAKLIKFIATSNVTPSEGEFDFTLNNEALLDKNAEIIDNSFIMAIKVLSDKNVKEIICAGFDGYKENTCNYADPELEYWFSNKKVNNVNSYVSHYLQEHDKCKITFITDSLYKSEGIK